MREIKFRVWNDVSKMIIDWGVLKVSPVFFTGILKGKVRHHIAMQFTGLKDGEGTDIYEGDIVTCSYSGLYKFSGYHEVKYSNEYGFSPIQEPVDYGEQYADADDWLVVGNIYENPELLELK